jgi:hypothetical protein
MLNHLIESYGRFAETERKEVASRMEVPWEGGPLEFVIQQISDAADAFDLAGTPLLAQQKTDKELYNLVKESGLLSDACQRWSMFPTADKTWAAATNHFQQYANDRAKELTTETAGYQRANHTQTNSNTGTLRDITSQLANLAARNESQNTEFRALQAELAANKAESAATKAMFTAYKEANKGRGSNGGGSNKNRCRNNGGGNDNTNNSNETAKYCWTHGLCYHSGAQCKARTTKHQPDATATNTRGGCQAGF